MERMQVGGAGLEIMRIAAPPETESRAPLVFLHEGLGSVAMWGGWPLRVCQSTGRAGLAYSRRGYGDSDAVPDVRGPPREAEGQRIGRLPPDYMHREAWVMLPQLLEQARIEFPVLIGHSDGGSIALLYASRFPVAACVVMAPHVMVEEVSIRAIEQASDDFRHGDLRERLRRYHRDIDCAFWQWNDAWLNPAFRSFDIRGDCRRITAPVLAIQGCDDRYGTMQQIEDITTAHGPAQQKKLDRCGHSPHRDQHDLTLELVTAFLATLP